eukprot:CAMPEP_0116867916 /NCGR_PEP_ID=MMETSP0418-20121206/26889_1 /TAXON_ID=1158023 /ORGANISM="Astrosyne radiata, Strain 13vi08-1A" /LENGTH=163 /DNA_ID=CAMNT_0004503793 /DNA_START=30 /DNA_END=522 /DNA_ORIENTATION=+
MPNDGPTFWEVTASGIDSALDEPESSMATDNGIYQYECQIPFVFQNERHDDCTMDHGHVLNPDGTEAAITIPDKPWCSVETDEAGKHIPGKWGYCLDKDKELLSEDMYFVSGEHGCNGSPFHICSAQANYGGVVVDWANRTLTMAVFTPHARDPLAADVKIAF